ncbi:HDA5 [Symbiodinium sp. CCMP2592]|nr:HDA5 [Symbiodinium sp. CCMP2592]
MSAIAADMSSRCHDHDSLAIAGHQPEIMQEHCQHGDPAAPKSKRRKATSHPEEPQRLRACLAGITLAGLWPKLTCLPARMASDEELVLCHSREHLEGLKAASLAAARLRRPLWLPPGGCLDGIGEEALTSKHLAGRDTYITEGSLEAARFASGALLSLVDECLGGGSLQGLAFCRPPGHHAGLSSSTGFCLLNNVALAAQYARARYPDLVKRVLIFDWDVHHGQGTQEIFWSDPDVLFVSIHQFEPGFYPNSGTAMETGAGKGKGYTINVAMPPGYGDDCLWLACAKVLLPAARTFRPDLVLVSAGFDAVEGDPLGGATCSPSIFGQITRELKQLAQDLCHGRILFGLEGGYASAGLAMCVGNVAQALLEPKQRGNDEPFAIESDLSPKQGSLLAIYSTRLAHQKLPLRLLEGSCCALVPFGTRASGTMRPEPRIDKPAEKSASTG